MTGMLVDRVKEQGAQRVKAVAKKIAKESPRLADLNAEDLERLAKVVVAEGLKDDLKQAARLEKIDLAGERDRFLSRLRSKQTQRAYRTALGRLETWCSSKGITVLEMTPALADDSINEMRLQGDSSATVRLRVAGVSAFFTWLERRHDEVKNPFRGTRERPPSKATRKLEVPSAEEITIMVDEADGELKAAIMVMSRIGLRVGALPGLRINGSTWSTTSKGKDINGDLPTEVKREIAKAGLSARAPFETTTVWHLSDTFRYMGRRLHGEGKIKALYSVHDLRHAFAKGLYLETRDIYLVSRALHHATIDVTARYLRSLGMADLK